MGTRAPRRPAWTPGMPLDAALLRLPVDGAHWAEDIPPVPAEHDVTAVLSAAALAWGHGDALELLGYRVIDADRMAGDGEADEGAVELLVRQALLDEHPAWWRTMADRAERVWWLSLGPVARMLAGVVRVHLEPLRA